MVLECSQCWLIAFSQNFVYIYKNIYNVFQDKFSCISIRKPKQTVQENACSRPFLKIFVNWCHCGFKSINSNHVQTFSNRDYEPLDTQRKCFNKNMAANIRQTPSLQT